MERKQKRHRSTKGLLSFLLVGLAVFGVAHTAHAQVVFDPAITYTTSKVTDNALGVSADDKTLTADLKLSYLFTAQGVFVGGMYKHEDASLTGGDVEGFAVGPTVGWTTGPWLFAGTYHFVGERRITAGGVETKYTEPKGFQIDVAYTHMVTPDFGFGPQLTYRDVKFDKSRIGAAAETSLTREEKSLEPYLAFHFQF